MWPYLVGVETFSRTHLEDVEARLAHLNATRIVSGVWLIRSDHAPEALWTALRAMLDDWESFFLLAVDEDFYSHNLEIRHV